MPVEHEEHQVIQDVRLHRGHDESVSTAEVAQHEALHLSLLDREKREQALRDFSNKAADYDQRLGTDLRKTGQVHRFSQYLKSAHQRLTAAGR